MKQILKIVNTFYGEIMKHIKRLLLLLIIFLIITSLTYFISYLLPSFKMIHNNEINIYDRNDKLIMQTTYDLEGSYLTYEQINPDFVYAFIASEDEDFNSHIGFSIKGLFRALYNNTFNGTTQGGSTISQQLARSLFLDNSQSIIRKIKEAFYTISLETHYEKKQIIEQYLNCIYLGHNIYGIEHASFYYFNKTNTKLSLDEVCLIVGIASAPNLYAPDIDYQKALLRRNYVLKRLKQTKYISETTYLELINKQTIMNYGDLSFKNPITPFYFYLKNLLNKYHLDTKTIKAQGINIYTTIDYEIQNYLYQNVLEYAPNDESEISAIIMKANSSDVLAMIGGYDLNNQYNRALNATRPMGSTIKPLLYYLALKAGMNPTTFLDCQKKDFHINGYEIYSPSNATNKYATHKINMIEAIGLSDNIYATKTLLFVGFDNFEKLLNRFDINDLCVPSSALGVCETTLLKITSIYNCFASLGLYYQPRIVKKIETLDKTLLYKQNILAQRILDRPYVFILNQLLRAPFDKNLIDYTKPTLLNYQTNNYFAAKTGTDNYNSYTIGYNPLYTIGVWCGTDDNSPLNYTNISKKIFQEMANTITSTNYWYQPPSYIEIKNINPITGENSLQGSIYWEIKKS